MNNNFRFTDNALDCIDNSDCLVIRIQKQFESKTNLFRFYAEKLKFPSYFDYNWDAFNDCIADLSWLPSIKIYIHHDCLPDLPVNDLRIYMSILDYAINCNLADNITSKNKTVLMIGFAKKLENDVMCYLSKI